MNLNVAVNTVGTTEPASSHGERIVVVGAGPVGLRCAQELSKAGQRVVLFNGETAAPYNRVKLTPLLAGEAQIGQILSSQTFSGPGSVSCYNGVSILDIDRNSKAVVASTGRIEPYDKLVLALGSRAFVPAIKGAELDNVFTFRDLRDAEALLARSFAARRALVIGGGLLGLEAARGLLARGTQVTVVEHEDRLMPRQIDKAAAQLLKTKIENLNISVRTGDRVSSIDGEDRVEAVTFDSGERVVFDTVIFCTGVRANTQLASAVGIAVHRGILVDVFMRTSDPDIYAIGECAEVDGYITGLVGPGYQQATTAVEHIAGGSSAPFEGAIPTTKLKVLGADVFSIGDFESAEQQPNVNSFIYQDKEAGIYRRIMTRRGKLIAALGVGEWPEAAKLQRAVSKQSPFRIWNAYRFRKSGWVWRESEEGAASLPAEAIICNCTGVTKGVIQNAITLGETSLDELKVATSCSTVCGTCKPLVLELLGEGSKAPEPARWWKAIVGISAVAGLLALITLLMPPIPLSDTFKVDELFRQMWIDSFWKQYSGYTLLGLTVLAALIGLRKRLKFLSNLGSYEFWRIIHLAIGVASAVVLVWHTGFRIGNNLNLVLMLSFLTVLVFGAIAGLATGGDHQLTEKGLSSPTKPARKLPLWVHIVGLWPLPALIAFHVLVVYAY